MPYYAFSFVSSVLERRLLDPLDAGTPEGERQADDLWWWAKENILLSSEFIEFYKQERVKRKAKAKKKGR